MSEFSFSNASDLEAAVQDSLPVYLSPSVHFPSAIAPIVLTNLIVIPLCCVVRKALTLYNHLEWNARKLAEDQQVHYNVTWFGTCLYVRHSIPVIPSPTNSRGSLTFIGFILGA